MRTILALMTLAGAAVAMEPPAYAPVEPPAAVTKCFCGGVTPCQCGSACCCSASYAAVYARVLAGEKVTVANGIAATQGQVACVIPGESPGIYECWSEQQRFCNGVSCQTTTVCHMRKLPIPHPMPATKVDGPSIHLDGMLSGPSSQAPSNPNAKR